MEFQCLLQKFTSCCIARDIRMLHNKMFIINAVQKIIQTSQNGGFAGQVHRKLPRIPEAPCSSLFVEHTTIGRSFSQLLKVEPEYFVAKMGITCQDLTNHRISQNWDIGF